MPWILQYGILIPVMIISLSLEEHNFTRYSDMETAKSENHILFGDAVVAVLIGYSEVSISWLLIL